MTCNIPHRDLQVIDAAVGGSSATVGVVGGVAGAAHQATVTTVDQTQIITLQVGVILIALLIITSCDFIIYLSVLSVSDIFASTRKS